MPFEFVQQMCRFVWACEWCATGLNGHEVGKVFAKYPHSLGAVTPNMIIIYCNYGLGESIGRGSQAQISAVTTVTRAFSRYESLLFLRSPFLWCVSTSNPDTSESLQTIHRYMMKLSHHRPRIAALLHRKWGQLPENMLKNDNVVDHLSLFVGEYILVQKFLLESSMPEVWSNALNEYY